MIKGKNLRFFLSFLFIVILVSSCSQKYDGAGLDILEPHDHEIIGIVSDSVILAKLVVDSVNFTNSSYLYLGKGTGSKFHDVNAELLVSYPSDKLKEEIDSMSLRIRSFSSLSSLVGDSCISWKVFDNKIAEKNGFLNPDTLNILDSGFCKLIEDTLYNPNPYFIELKLDKEQLSSYFSEGKTPSFRFSVGDESLGNDSLLKFYSSEWGAIDYKPSVLEFFNDKKVNRYKDSIVSQKSILSVDMNYIVQPSDQELIESDGTKFKLGSITGEGIALELKVPNSYNKDISLITGRLVLSKYAEDSIFGNLKYSDEDRKTKIYVYMPDSNSWQDDITKLTYDSASYWQFELSKKDTTYLDIRPVVEKWIRDSSSNHGLYIKMGNWGNPGAGYFKYEGIQIGIYKE